MKTQKKFVFTTAVTPVKSSANIRFQGQCRSGGGGGNGRCGGSGKCSK